VQTVLKAGPVVLTAQKRLLSVGAGSHTRSHSSEDLGGDANFGGRREVGGGGTWWTDSRHGTRRVRGSCEVYHPLDLWIWEPAMTWEAEVEVFGRKIHDLATIRTKASILLTLLPSPLLVVNRSIEHCSSLLTVFLYTRLHMIH